MEVFINLGVVGIALIILGKSPVRKNNPKQNLTNIKILDKFLSYMESDILGNINFKYGKLLFITGIIGALFYNTLGLFMVFAMVLVLCFYLVNLFISGHKFYTHTK